jgi:hypothetical protein
MPFLKIHTIAAFFHNEGKFPFNTVSSSMCFEQVEYDSEQSMIIKIETPYRPADYDDMQRRIAGLKSEREIESTLKT